MKQLILIVTTLISITIYAQVGIGTTNPNNSAQLDITSTNKGLLIPRVSLIALYNTTTPINNPTEGLLVYNTNPSLIGGGVGFYYFDGSLWKNIDTDNQKIDYFFFNTANKKLYISNENDGQAAQFVDLSSLQDGTGTDDQKIDYLNFNTSNNILSISNENDGEIPKTVDLSSLKGANTLNQAYNEGGLGSGRTIIANNGDVQIRGGFGLTVKNNIKLGYQISHEGDAGNNITFTPDKMVFSTGFVNFMEIDKANNEVIFNSTGVLNDFRIKTPTNPNIFFVDASAKKIGIKNGAPDAELDVNGTVDVVDNVGGTINIGGINYNEDTFTVSRNISKSGAAIKAELTSLTNSITRSVIKTTNNFTNMDVDINENDASNRAFGIRIKKPNISYLPTTGVNVYLNSSTPAGNYTATHIGSDIDMTYNGLGSLYGNKIILKGTYNAAKYGLHVKIPETAGGQHFGIYSDVQKNTGYAGFFIGRVVLGSNTSRYIMPLADGTANQVMATDGLGHISFVNPSFADTQNTLDQAYDEGGAGAGRTITADNGAVTINGTDGFIVTGTTNSGAVAPSGAGTKMFFNPRKAAFRAGNISSTHWDDSNIGRYSFAVGVNTIASAVHSVAMGNITTASGNAASSFGKSTVASGINSFAMGELSIASGGNSLAMGYDTEAQGVNSVAFGNTTTASGNMSLATGLLSTASGTQSVAMGGGSTASGDRSLAMGGGTTASGILSISGGLNTMASGDLSMAIGSNLNAPSYIETVFGALNTNYTPNSTTTWDASDRLFVIGNGVFTRSNALTIYKNGRMNINDAYNMPLADGIANQIMATDGSGNVSFVNANTIVTSNTLDQAYDEGGAGAGRTINTTNGAVLLNGNDGLEIRGAAAGINISNTTENESGIHFRDSGNTSQYADVNFDNSNANTALNMYVNSATPMVTLDDNQRVGIGTTTPSNKLAVAGTLNLNQGIGAGIALKVNGAEALWFNGTQFSWGFGGTANYFADKVGIGNNAPSYKLDVKNNTSGDYVAQIHNESTNTNADGLRIRLNATNPGAANYFVGFYNGSNVQRGRITGNGTGVTYNTTSDRRLKTNIVSIKNALQIIDKIQPRKYEFKANRGVEEFGFIAQELQTVYPQAVSGDPNGNVKTDPMMVDYSRLTPILAAGIKELNKKVKKLEDENNTLKQLLLKYKALETRINNLENKTN